MYRDMIVVEEGSDFASHEVETVKREIYRCHSPVNGKLPKTQLYEVGKDSLTTVRWKRLSAAHHILYYRSWTWNATSPNLTALSLNHWFRQC